MEFSDDLQAIYPDFEEEDEVLEESLLSKENTEINLELWKDGTILFITGNSGAGKSTLAKKMAEENSAVYFSMDSFLKVAKKDKKYCVEKFEEIEDKFLKMHLLQFIQNLPDEEFGYAPKGSKGKISEIRAGFNRATKTGLDFLDMFSKVVRNSAKKYVFEGTQLIQKGAEYFLDKPLIIVGTGYIKSAFRATKRAFKNKRIDLSTKLNVLFQRLIGHYYYRDSKMLDNFKREVLNLKEEFIFSTEEKLRLDMLFKIGREKVVDLWGDDELKRYFAAELGKHLSTEKIELRAVNYDYAVRYDNILALKFDFSNGFDFLVLRKKRKMWFFDDECFAPDFIINEPEWIITSVDGAIRIHGNQNMRGLELKRFKYPTIFFEIIKR